jgi:hypothetical protein
MEGVRMNEQDKHEIKWTLAIFGIIAIMILTGIIGYFFGGPG